MAAWLAVKIQYGCLMAEWFAFPWQHSDFRSTVQLPISSMTLCLHTVWLPYSYDFLSVYSMITIQLWLAVCILYDYHTAMTFCMCTVWLPYSCDLLCAYSTITVQHYDCLHTVWLPYSYTAMTRCLHTVQHYDLLFTYSRITIQLWLVYTQYSIMTCCLHTV